MEIPGLLILINDSITTAVQTVLATDTGIQPNELVPMTPFPSTVQGIDVQLEINETITLAEFNARIAVDPNYPEVIRLNKIRVLVISPNFHDHTNRELFDVVLFVKQGLASVERCKFGAPGFTLPVERINILNLIYGDKRLRNEVFCFPRRHPDKLCCPPCPRCPTHEFPKPICPPQTQTFENPRPPEHVRHRHPEGLGALELFGVEALEGEGIDEGVFGDHLRPEHHNPNRLADADEDDCCDGYKARHIFKEKGGENDRCEDWCEDRDEEEDDED
jgi:hypothetical protein